jgi:hypothetical protein
MYNNGKKVLLEPVQQQGVSGDAKELEVKVTQNGKHISIQNQVIFKCSDTASLEQIKTQYDVMNKYASLYIIEASSASEAVAIANELYESGLVTYAEPVVKKEVQW